jgi:hypothetical protein
MKRNRYQKWLQNIVNTQEEEISCSECFHWVSGYVEMELTGQDAPAAFPQVKHHLEQCQACREEYEILHDLSVLDKEENAPSIDDLKDLIR